MSISLPVRGLRPKRASFRLASKLPNPEISTRSPLFSACAKMPLPLLKSASTTLCAAVRVRLARADNSRTSSVLFMAARSCEGELAGSMSQRSRKQRVVRCSNHKGNIGATARRFFRVAFQQFQYLQRTHQLQQESKEHPTSCDSKSGRLSPQLRFSSKHEVAACAKLLMRALFESSVSNHDAIIQIGLSFFGLRGIGWCTSTNGYRPTVECLRFG